MSRFVDGRCPQRNISTTPYNNVQEKMGMTAQGFQESTSYTYCTAPNNRTVSDVEIREEMTVSTIIIPHEMMKRVIGRGGEIWKSICFRSGATCEKDRRPPVFCNTSAILIHGTNCQIDNAKSLIRNIAGEVNPKTGKMEPGAVHEDAPHQKWKSASRLRQPYPLDDLRYDKLTGLPDFRKQWIDYYVHVKDLDSANALNAEVMADERKLKIQGYAPDKVDWDWQDLGAWQTVTKKKIKLFCKKNLIVTEDVSASAQNFPQVNDCYMKVNDIPLCTENFNNSSDNNIPPVPKVMANEKIKTPLHSENPLQENERKTSVMMETCNPLAQGSVTKKMSQGDREPDNFESMPPFVQSNYECDTKCQVTQVIKEEEQLENKHKLTAFYRDNGKVAEAEAIENSIALTKVGSVTASVQAKKRAREEIQNRQVDSYNENDYEGDRAEQTQSDVEPIP